APFRGGFEGLYFFQLRWLRQSSVTGAPLSFTLGIHMQAAAFILSTIVLLFYATLASATLFLGHAISRGTLAAFFNAVLAGLNWLIPWGLVGVACCVVILLILGVRRSTRRVGAVILSVFALASASIVAILIQPSGGFGIGEVAFLLPCFAVVAVGVWLTFTN
ncbi:MAG: hypothetical protein ABL919_12765, partial [Methylococcales bacterium]